jgi:hypothetical protein
MGGGYLIMKSFQNPRLAWARVLTPAIPVIYFGALYIVFALGQQ